MQERSYRFVVQGVVVDGPLPLGRSEVALSPGVHALYGLNGAGKTRVLSAITDILRGVPHGDGFLFGRLDPTEEGGVEAYLDAVTDALERRRRWAKSRPLPPEAGWIHEERSPLDRIVGDALWMISTGALVDEMKGPLRSEETDALLIDEVVIQGRFSLSPSRGRTGEHRWDLDVLFDPYEGLELRREVDRLLASWRAFVEHLERNGITDYGSEEAEDAYWSLRPDGIYYGTSLLSWFTELGECARDGWVEGMARFFDSLGPGGPSQLHFTGYEPVMELATLSFNGSTVIDDSSLEPDRVKSKALRNLSNLNHVSDDDWREHLGLETGETPRRLTAVEGRVEVAPWLEDVCGLWSAAADSIASDLLVGAPRLRVAVHDPEDWFLGRTLSLLALDEGGTYVELPYLSTGQRRWTSLSFSIASEILHNPEPHPMLSVRSLVALDEPESGLHRTAERHAISGFVRLIQELDSVGLIATHSPAMIDHPDISLLHVFRNLEGQAVVSPMGSLLRQRIDVLGINPSDLLQLHRVCLLVEGRHDEVVLRALIGDELARLGVLIQPLHGARHLPSVADAQLLANFTEMPVIAMLDNARVDRIQSYWEALRRLDPSDTRAIDGLSTEHFGQDKQVEESFVTALARRLHQLGSLSRFEVFGLTKRDIPMYLPVERIVPSGGDWDALWAEHKAGVEAKRANWPKDFKKWLIARHGASFDDRDLQDAVAAMQDVPEEFVHLLHRCREVGRRAATI